MDEGKFYLYKITDLQIVEEDIGEKIMRHGLVYANSYTEALNKVTSWYGEEMSSIELKPIYSELIAISGEFYDELTDFMHDTDNIY